MARCNSDEDCSAGFRMICKSGKCTCKSNDLFFEWPKYGCFSKVNIFDPCVVSGQCIAMNPNTYCNPDNERCTCSPNYFFNGRECSMRYDNTNLKAQEVYKAAVVAAACFIVAIVGIFVACIVRRSFCRREQQLQQSESNRNSDIFSISDEIAALRAVDKPPSYEEVLQIERTFYGIPPPEYTAPTNGNTTISLPTNSAAAQTDRPGTFSTQVQPDVNTCESGSAGSEFSKDSTQMPSAPPVPICDNEISLQQTSNFLASAEVLPVPSHIERVHSFNSSFFPLSSNEPSHAMRLNHHYSTPPPRLHRNNHISVLSSFSLPASPSLNSSRQEKGGFSYPCTLPKQELSNQNCHSSQNPSFETSVSTPSCSQGENSSALLSAIEDTNSSNPEHIVSKAYDNLGFISDLHT